MPEPEQEQEQEPEPEPGPDQEPERDSESARAPPAEMEQDPGSESEPDEASEPELETEPEPEPETETELELALEPEQHLATTSEDSAPEPEDSKLEPEAESFSLLQVRRKGGWRTARHKRCGGPWRLLPDQYQCNCAWAPRKWFEDWYILYRAKRGTKFRLVDLTREEAQDLGFSEIKDMDMRITLPEFQRGL